MYEEFATVYDQFMDDFDYPAWARYYMELLEKCGYAGGEICECGCGTGSLSIELMRRGCKLLCSDLSESMLRVASEKAMKNGLRARFIRQDMRRIELPHRVDAVICACDGVNYLLTDADVASFLKSAFACLKPSGVLAFDISSRYKFEHVLSDGFFGEERENAAYLWQNTYDAEDRLMTMELTFFVKSNSSPLYRRFAESQVQRAHEASDILTLIADAGFTGACVYGDRNFEAPRPDELRLHFAAVKPRA